MTDKLKGGGTILPDPVEQVKPDAASVLARPLKSFDPDAMQARVDELATLDDDALPIATVEGARPDDPESLAKIQAVALKMAALSPSLDDQIAEATTVRDDAQARLDDLTAQQAEVDMASALGVKEAL